MNLFLSVVVPSGIDNKKNKKITIDETIFARIAEDDKLAFEELYRKTERIIYAFVLSYLKDHDDAQDVVQDTYLKIRAAAHLYKPMGKPMAWIFTIARNLSISKLRFKQKNDGVEAIETENDINFSYVSDQDNRMILQEAFKVLSNEEVTIILLHAVSGFTHREIAKNLDMKLSTVLSKYHRGLKKLKSKLKEHKR